MTVVPRGDTELRPGDVVTVVVDPKQEGEMRAYFVETTPRLMVAPS